MTENSIDNACPFTPKNTFQKKALAHFLAKESQQDSDTTLIRSQSPINQSWMINPESSTTDLKPKVALPPQYLTLTRVGKSTAVDVSPEKSFSSQEAIFFKLIEEDKFTLGSKRFKEKDWESMLILANQKKVYLYPKARHSLLKRLIKNSTPQEKVTRWMISSFHSLPLRQHILFSFMTRSSQWPPMSVPPQL